MDNLLGQRINVPNLPIEAHPYLNPVSVLYFDETLQNTCVLDDSQTVLSSN
jgi:hypothetical protein